MGDNERARETLARARQGEAALQRANANGAKERDPLLLALLLGDPLVRESERIFLALARVPSLAHTHTIRRRSGNSQKAHTHSRWLRAKIVVRLTFSVRFACFHLPHSRSHSLRVCCVCILQQNLSSRENTTLSQLNSTSIDFCRGQTERDFSYRPHQFHNQLP